MKINHVADIAGGQDGAIWNGYFFRFNSIGVCKVYKIDDSNIQKISVNYISSFSLENAGNIIPHSNSVVFGNEYYNKDDKFPLLYCNVYNSYAKSENKLKGVCCVYRLQQNDDKFSAVLVQLIEIGFVEDETLWKSENTEDLRPFGNFVIDRENSVYYGFTMRDETKTTRYFSFNLPKISDGETDNEFNVKKVVLKKEDIKEYFDCDYHLFIQGACFHKDKIYSLEGFSDHEQYPPAIRVINTKTKQQELYKKFSELGTNIEPEMIDFYNGICYYCDSNGHFYNIEF